MRVMRSLRSYFFPPPVTAMPVMFLLSASVVIVARMPSGANLVNISFLRPFLISFSSSTFLSAKLYLPSVTLTLAVTNNGKVPKGGPWTSHEDALFTKRSACEVAKQAGRRF